MRQSIIATTKTNETSSRSSRLRCLTLSSCISMFFISTSATATDLEIYAQAGAGQPVVTLMLDISGSMEEIDYSSITCWGGLKEVQLDGYGFTSQYCRSITGDRYYRRIDNLKKGIYDVVNSEELLNNVKIGVGVFPRRNSRSTKFAGTIEIPAKLLTEEHRQDIKDFIDDIRPNGGTPTAQAYAEAGAYMMGTTPLTTVKDSFILYKETFIDDRGAFGADLTGKDEVCISWEQPDPSTLSSSNNIIKCEQWTKSLDSVPQFTTRRKLDIPKIERAGHVIFNEAYNWRVLNYYYKAIEYDDPAIEYMNLDEDQYPLSVSTGEPNPYSGFIYSNPESKSDDRSHYVSPIKDLETSTCAASGIYFLTDGYPNSSGATIAKTVMNTALTPVEDNLPAQLSTTCSAPGNQGWDCIFDFSQKLLDTNNPIGLPIKTATVGFGSAFDSITDASSEAECIAQNPDVSNLCKWGFRGEGGFYYAKDSTGIVKSVKDLIQTLSTDIEPVSTGTMSVPLDSLSTLKSRKFAYLPILEPLPSQAGLWPGNLKKYNIKNATLEGGNDRLVFANKQGQFAKDTWDIWNTITRSATELADMSIPRDDLRPDQALVQVGGTFQKIFENGATSADTGSRRLYVNSNGSLVNLKVQNKKPVNFTPGLSARFNNTDKLNLLSFMGYDELSDVEVENTEELDSEHSKWTKNVGGVLHSIPQLITTEVKLDNQGKFIDGTRKDYIIYGSMDGALHMVDDATGKEVFNFVPKQILELQSEALSSAGTTASGRIPYGVDGPWSTYTSYTTTQNTVDDVTTNLYRSNQIFTMGGLRMGGSMYYGLDISDINSPKLLYSVGSTYSNQLEGLTDTVVGVQNDVVTTEPADQTSQQKALSRMGQSWGKPAIGYVKSGGKRVMVNFLPGGYDECYEDPTFKLNSTVNKKDICNSKAAAQGNAMYMVQVGVEQTRDNKKTYFASGSDSGKLLWWASNTGSTSAGNTSALQYTNSADLKHSIVTEARVVDRNYDGLTDHIYFADLGGQVWRVDINNNMDSDNFQVDRVQKILDVSDQASDGDAPPRFYERPLLTFYNSEYAFKDSDNVEGSYNGVMALITVGTGDRSNPVSSVRSTPDAIYNVIDKDVVRLDLFDYSDRNVSNVLRTPTVIIADNATDGNTLAELTFTDSDIGEEGLRYQMQSNAAQGWYMPLTHWQGDAVDDYKIKMLSEPDALAGILISSSYNPDAGNTAGECSAGVIGQTQRERMCLPFGACDDEEETPRAFALGGIGIADNFITQFNDTPVFTSLQTYCEGTDCEPVIICPNGNCEDVLIDEEDDRVFDQCTGLDCVTTSGGGGGSINVEERLNPLEWMEF